MANTLFPWNLQRKLLELLILRFGPVGQAGYRCLARVLDLEQISSASYASVFSHVQ